MALYLHKTLLQVHVNILSDGRETIYLASCSDTQQKPKYWYYGTWMTIYSGSMIFSSSEICS